MTEQLPSFTTLILAGGRGTRMGGQDKGLVCLNDKPMISYLLNTVADLCDDIMISCNRSQQQYAEFGYHLVSDGNTRFFGPLAGLLSGIKLAQHSHLLVLPCDTPAVTKRLIRRLAQCAHENPDSICMAHDGQRPQPLHAMIPVKFQQSLADCIAANQHSVMGWYSQHHLRTVNCEDLPGDFANANRPEELTLLSAMLSSRQ